MSKISLDPLVSQMRDDNLPGVLRWLSETTCRKDVNIKNSLLAVLNLIIQKNFDGRVLDFGELNEWRKIENFMNLVKFLVERGADVDAVGRTISLETDQYSVLAWLLFIESRHGGFIKPLGEYIIDQGADPYVSPPASITKVSNCTEYVIVNRSVLGEKIALTKPIHFESEYIGLETATDITQFLINHQHPNPIINYHNLAAANSIDIIQNVPPGGSVERLRAAIKDIKKSVKESLDKILKDIPAYIQGLKAANCSSILNNIYFLELIQDDLDIRDATLETIKNVGSLKLFDGQKIKEGALKVIQSYGNIENTREEFKKYAICEMVGRDTYDSYTDRDQTKREEIDCINRVLDDLYKFIHSRKIHSVEANKVIYDQAARLKGFLGEKVHFGTKKGAVLERDPSSKIFSYLSLEECDNAVKASIPPEKSDILVEAPAQEFLQLQLTGDV